MEKQPTQEELDQARAQARADADAQHAGAADEQPGEQPFAYAAEAVQAAYARAYEDRLEELRRHG